MTPGRLVLALALGLCAAPASADEFRMRDGQVHVGDVVEESSTAFRVRVPATAFLKTRVISVSKRNVETRRTDVGSVAPSGRRPLSEDQDHTKLHALRRRLGTL